MADLVTGPHLATLDCVSSALGQFESEFSLFLVKVVCYIGGIETKCVSKEKSNLRASVQRGCGFVYLK